MPETDRQSREEFMRLSLGLLASQLKAHRQPGYPGIGNRFRGMQSILLEAGRLELDENDPWNVGQAVPTDEEHAEISQLGYPTDSLGRPKHPWARNMAADVAIGVVMGKGFFRKWGPNPTVDPIVVQAGNILLVDRDDTGLPALPGGFRDLDEITGLLEEPLPAAIRELGEETGMGLLGCVSVARLYEGPVVDIRMTANAWPETTAILFDMGNNPSLPLVSGGDDAKKAYWKPIEETRRTQLHGSHNLLVEQAIQRL